MIWYDWEHGCGGSVPIDTILLFDNFEEVEILLKEWYSQKEKIKDEENYRGRVSGMDAAVTLQRKKTIKFLCIVDFPLSKQGIFFITLRHKPVTKKMSQAFFCCIVEN